MNGDISRAFNVFVGEHQRADCLYLLDLNEQRKLEVDKWWRLLLDDQNAYAPYAYITPAPSGLRGLLAMKVMQQTRLPSLVVGSNGHGGYSGSGRSPVWYPFLSRTKGRVYASGHEGAFGIGLTNQQELADIVDFVADDSAKVLSETPEATEVHYDFVIATDGSGDVGIDVPLFKEFYDALAQFKPFGHAFEQPHILLKFDMEHDEVFVKTMGKHKEHLKLLLPYGFSVVCWNQGHIADKLQGEVQVEGIIEENVWNDIIGMQFKGSVIECLEQ
jgi:single-stranded-DNA-specific exonuclease